MLTLSSFVFQTYVFSSQLRFHLLLFPVIVGWMLLVQILKHLFLRSFRFYIFDILCIFLRFTFLSKIFFLHLVVTSCTYVFVFFVYLSLVLFAIKYLHFFFFFFCSASRYFVILLSLVFAFRFWFLCWDVCYSGRFVWVRFLFIFSFSCSVVLFLKKNVKHSSKIRPSTKKRETFTKLTPKWGPPYRGPKNVKKWRF